MTNLDPCDRVNTGKRDSVQTAMQATAAELADALESMLRAFSMETEYMPLEQAAPIRLAAKKAARVALMHWNAL